MPDGVVVGNGSNELIQATLSVVLAQGEAVVAPSPTFSLYRLLTGVLGGRYVPVPLGPGFEFDVDRIVDTAVRERARVIVLNSPNNPTGSALPDGAVERLLAETDALDCLRRGLPGLRRTHAPSRCLRQKLAAGGPAHLLQGDGDGGTPLRPRAGAPGGGA